MRMAISNVVMMKLMMMKLMMMKLMLMKVMLMPILIRSALAELKNKFNRSAASSDITINRKVSLLFISPLIRSMLLNIFHLCGLCLCSASLLQVNYKCPKCERGFRFMTQLKDHTASKQGCSPPPPPPASQEPKIKTISCGKAHS